MPLLRILICSLLALAGPVAAADRTLVPAEFVNDQVWVTPALGGERLRFFTDTGGGWNAISESLVERLSLVREQSEGGELVAWPAFDDEASIPAAPLHFKGGRLAVTPREQLSGADGFLGGRWFADGVWEFDYPKRRLYRLTGFAADAAQPHRAALGFQTNAAGQRTMHFPSINVEIDGEVLQMLFDSGATATTTNHSASVFGVAPGTNVGISFIEHEVFERWATAHPNWRVIEAADLKGKQERRMIEVPMITIAGHAVGPVWFSEQPAGAFQSYMARMMDRPTWGALGGSGLRYFRVVVDYPGSAAYFHR